MKGIEIFLGLSQVEGKYVEEAEYGVFHPEKGDLPKSVKRLPLRKALLIAAAIVLILALAGCAVAYVLHLQDLHMGSRESWADNFDEDMNYLGRETFTEQVFSLSGLKDSPAYQGAKAWFDFTQSYDPDGTIQASVWSDPPKFPEKYDAYYIYSQEMAEKIDEIAEKYGLSLLGARVKGASGKALFRYYGVENLLNADSAAGMDTLNAWTYEGGSLYSDFFLRLPENTDWPYETLCSYRLNSKNALSTDIFTQADGSGWREWNYTTASGDQVLILRNEDGGLSWILCDRADAMVSLRIQSEHSAVSDEGGRQHFENTPMTDRQLEQAADNINWKLELKPGDPALLDGSAGDSGEAVQIQNGVAVALKKVETDGITAFVTLGITAPEGIKLPQSTGSELGSLGFDTWTFGGPSSREELGGDMSYMTRDDGDGKDNTADFVICANFDFADGKDTFIPGEVWKLYLEDIRTEAWNSQTTQFDTFWKTEGAWSFDITIGEDNDFREVELVKEPFTTSGVVGMSPDGNDKFVDVTLNSVKLRTFSTNVSGIAYDEITAIDFFIGPDRVPKLVMKDGREIALALSTGKGELFGFNGDDFREGVSLDEIDYLLLADGTKLTPVT